LRVAIHAGGREVEEVVVMRRRRKMEVRVVTALWVRGKRRRRIIRVRLMMLYIRGRK